MYLYRIAKSEERCKDLTGFGAFRYGGRWNSVGTYMLYTSENSSLAYLENLVHFEPENFPPNLYIAKLELNVPINLIHTLPEDGYSENWQVIGSMEIKKIGDNFIKSQEYPALKVRSAVNTSECNYLLNPLFSDYNKILKLLSIRKLDVDSRLFK